MKNITATSVRYGRLQIKEKVRVHYYVDTYSSWFVVRTANLRRARAIGVDEFGRGHVCTVREATQREIDDYVANKGEAALAEH